MTKEIKKSPDPPEPETQVPKRQKIISWAVFIPTLAVVFTSLITVVFPALITRATSQFQDAIYKPDVIDPYQTGYISR